MIHLTKHLKGSILDIGGGGEGVIGRLYGNQVTAIDNSQEELEEAPDGFAKVFMDATKLTYAKEAFHHATFFYSMMYMTQEEQCVAISEAARVLKPGGTLSIWDCEIPSAYPDPFCVDLDISIQDQTLHTTYGVVKMCRQDYHSIVQMCLKAGLVYLSSTQSNGQFYIVFEKKN